MFSKIHKRISYTNVILTIGLVFAMTGGAYAAKKYLITSTKQISPSVLKSLQGKAGPSGTPGTPGAQGPAGAQGAQGPAGPVGSKGDTGASGSNGESVTSTTLAKGATCPAGGAEFKTGATKTHACNGEKGEPWTAGGTLPSGKTETGFLAMQGMPGISGGEPRMASSISFPIPLSEAATVNIIGIEEGEHEASEKLPEENGALVCKGNMTAPVAEPGHLCIFISHEFRVEAGRITTLSPPGGQEGKTGDSGVALVAYGESPASTEKGLELLGVWAVTAK